MPRRARALLAVCALLAATAAAAQTGGITVRVVGSDGAPLPGATVTIHHATGYVKTTALMTDSHGEVEFPVLRPGPGYSIRVDFPGHSPVQESGLRVPIGDTVHVAVQMMEQLQEQVTVTARREMIDLDKSETTTKFSANFIADLPVPGRFYQNLLTLVPGVQDADGDGNPNVHGSRERDFSMMVSGVRNVDPLTGQWMSRVNLNSIEEMEVITAGAGVEFGRAQGGFGRIIQKQGSNEHEGLFEYRYRTSRLDRQGSGFASTIDDPKFDNPKFEWKQPSLQISGPILRDRLWYRLTHERRTIEEPINVGSRIAVTETEEWTHSDVLTWQVSPRNKLAAMFEADPSRIMNFGVSSVRPEESTWTRTRSGQSYKLIWTAPVSPRILVESLAAWQDLNFGLAPTTSGVRNDCLVGPDYLELSQCKSLDNGRFSGSYYRTQDDHSQRFTTSSKASLYSRFWGMSHRFQLGVSVENERYFRSLTQDPFGVFFTNSLLDPVNPQPSLGHIARYQVRISVPQADDVRATGTNWGVFGEDQIKPRSNLTLTLGMRIDREELSSEGRSTFDPSAEFLAYNALIEPLAAVELFGPMPNPVAFDNQAAAIFPQIFTGYEDFGAFTHEMQAIICAGVPASSIGQCLTIVNQQVLSQQNNQLQHVRRAENVTNTNTNFSPFLSVAWSPWSDGKTAIKAAVGRHYNNIPLIIPLQELEPALTELHYRRDPDSGVLVLEGGIKPTLTVQTVDRNLRTPYQDELTLKLERELWPETELQLTYIKRKFRDQIQDVNVNWANGDFGVCSFQFQSPSSRVQPSPGAGQRVFDPFANEAYLDTDPGIGDGRLDDCAGNDITVASFGGGSTTFRRPDGFLDLYVQNPFWGDILRIGNSNRIDYEGYVLELIRRLYRSWELQASYTWSKAKGDGEDFFQELGNDPSLRQDVQGYQSYDQRHVVKFNATTVTPWGVRLGTALSWQSGLPFSKRFEDFSDDLQPPVYALSHLASVSGRVRQTYPTGRRNDQRNPSYWNIDLVATRQIKLPHHVDLQLSAEIFNLLDDGTYTIYNTFVKEGEQLNGVNDAYRRFGRRWQLGVKLAF